MKKLRYVIVGTGRCGTVYQARLLTSMGFPCGHETVFDCLGLEGALGRLKGEIPFTLSNVSQKKFDGKYHHDIPDWLGDIKEIVAESSYMAAPYLSHECLADTEFIHIVRHPVKVINSFLNYIGFFQKKEPSNVYGRAWEYFIYNHLPELKNGALTPEERASLYYVRWNQMIDDQLTNRRHVRVRAEDGPRQVVQFVGYEGDGFFDDRLINTLYRPGVKFFLSDLRDGSIKRELVAIADRYGYPLESKDLMI